MVALQNLRGRVNIFETTPSNIERSFLLFAAMRTFICAARVRGLATFDPHNRLPLRLSTSVAGILVRTLQ